MNLLTNSFCAHPGIPQTQAEIITKDFKKKNLNFEIIISKFQILILF